MRHQENMPKSTRATGDVVDQRPIQHNLCHLAGAFPLHGMVTHPLRRPPAIQSHPQGHAAEQSGCFDWVPLGSWPMSLRLSSATLSCGRAPYLYVCPAVLLARSHVFTPVQNAQVTLNHLYVAKYHKQARCIGLQKQNTSCSHIQQRYSPAQRWLSAPPSSTHILLQLTALPLPPPRFLALRATPTPPSHCVLQWCCRYTVSLRFWWPHLRRYALQPP